MNSFNYTQICRNCRLYCKTFKVTLNYYDNCGKSKLSSEEIYESFSFTCGHCRSLNVLDFEMVCNKETILYLKIMQELEKHVEAKKITSTIEKLNITDK